MKRIIYYVFSLTFSVMFFGSAYGTPVPEGTDRYWIGQELRQSGMPMQIEGFKTRMSVSTVMDFYRQEWQVPVSDNAPGFVENVWAEWKIISRLENGNNTVVQVKRSQNGGAEGYISSLDTSVSASLNQVTKEFPKPSQSQLVSSTESDDSGIKSTTIFLVAPQSVASVEAYYRDRMIERGYTLAKGLKHDGTSVLFFIGKGQKVDIAIKRGASGSQIYASVAET